MTHAVHHRIDPADIERAQAFSVADIAVERGLGLKKVGGELIGPCPRCGGTDRFGINTAADVFNCRGCTGKGKGAISFVMFVDRCGFRAAISTLTGRAFVVRGNPGQPGPQSTPKTSDEHDRRQKVRWLWSHRMPIVGSIAETYLREVRGIACPLPPTLAFLPPLKPGHHPALISAFGLCDEIKPGIVSAPREVVALHLTLLRADGTGKAEVKPNKIMIGRAVEKRLNDDGEEIEARLPIILAPPNDLLGLAITEGIEDGLSVHEALGLGTWCAGSAPHLGKLDGIEPDFIDSVVPDWIDAVTIFADVDQDRQGERSATRLANRLRERGIDAIIEGLDDE